MPTARASSQEGEGGADRRRLPRGPDRGPLGQGAGPEILVADQGQAGLVRGAPGGRESVVNEQLGTWFEEHPAEAQGDRRQGGRGRRRPRGGAEGARADAPQGRARHGLAARQARRLPGARPGEVRDLHRRGRLGRRLGQAGPEPREPGGAAAARQDPQCRAGALRQDAVVRADRHADPALGTGIGTGRVQRRQAALPQDHHHDGRRRRRRPYPHAAAHLLLPPDAGADRARPHLHRPAAALQGQARLVRASTSRTSGRSRTTWSTPASTTRCCGSSTGESRAGADLADIVDEARAVAQVLERPPLALRPHASSSRRRSPARSTATSSPSPSRPRRRRPTSPRRLDKLAEEGETRLDRPASSPTTASASSARCAASSEVAVIDPALLEFGRCAEARRRSPPGCSRSTASPPRFRRKDDETADPRAARPARRGARRRPEGHLAAALQGPRRDERRAALGDDARPRSPHAPPGQGARGRRGRRPLRPR